MSSDDLYFLPPGYVSRHEPEYFVDENLNAVWQPDVYPETAAVARRLGARRIVDVGCGTAGKLVELHPEFEIVGIDFGPNIEACRKRHDFGSWVEADFDRDASLAYDDVAGAVLVCADVIEHLVHPELLLASLRRALDSGAVALFLSTPERDLYSGPGHLGPPANPAHVREWARPELERLLASHGLHGHLGLTRSNDVMPYMQTTLAVVPGDASAQEVVAQWWDERGKWERLAVEQDRLIAEKERIIEESEAAKAWLDEQRAAWQQTAEEALEASSRKGSQQAVHPETGPGDRNAQTETLTMTTGTIEVQERTAVFAYDQAAEPEPAQVTIVTEASHDDASALIETARSLLSQSLQAWAWTIVAPIEIAPPFPDPRIKVVAASVRARTIRDVVSATRGDLALVEPGDILEPTTLEKWAWYLDAHLDVPAVSGMGRPPPGAPRMLRRSAVERAGGLDAAYATLGGSSFGYVPYTGSIANLGVDGPDLHTWRTSAASRHARIPEHTPFENRLEKTAPRLLLIAPFMTLGGADKVSLDLIGCLRQAGWEITVATTLADDHSLLPLYAQHTPDLFPLAHFVRLVDYPRFLRYLIASRQHDVVLISNSELGYRLLPYLRACCPEPAYVDFCHSEAEHWNDGGYPRLSVVYQELLDLTLTASAHLRRWMGARGADVERIEVCYANVDSGLIRPDADARHRARARLGVADDTPLVLFVGRVSEDKQPHVLAGTVRELHARGVRFHLAVAGSGPELSWLSRFFGRHRLAGVVHLLGAVPHEQIADLYSAADVFFLPSRSEGIALTLYEAMAAEVPVVAAAVGGQAELVTPETGILVPRGSPEEESRRYADALELLLGDADRRKSLGVAARQRVVTGFRTELMGKRIDELLRQTVKRHSDASPPAVDAGAGRAIATEVIAAARDSEKLAAAARGGNGGRPLFLKLNGPRAYSYLERVCGPSYRWAVARGLPGLPVLNDALRRRMLGY